MSSQAVSSESAVAAAEKWFIRHGLPYFVDSERAEVRRGSVRGD